MRMLSRSAALFALAAVPLPSGAASAADPLYTEGPLVTGIRPDTPVTFGAFSDLAQRAAPAVVSISTETTVRGDGLGFPFGGPQVAEGAGSGFIIRADGYVLSNNHVVENARKITVHLLDGRQLPARLIGRDPATDVSLLKVEAGGEKLPVVPLGNSDKLTIGEWVVAIGNPMGLSHTVTAGIVSAKGRREVRPDGRLRYPDFIQTDASINPGNSGGPLFNTAGEVVGINTAISAHAQGIGFAIPINMVKTILPSLSIDGRVSRSWLGVQIQEVTPELAASFGLAKARGALIAGVVPGGPAETAGITDGDVIVQFGDTPIERHDDLPWLASNAGVGKQVSLRVLHEGNEREVRVRLTALPGEDQVPSRANPGEKRGERASVALGIALETIPAPILQRLELPGGVLVARVDPGSAAARAGLERGDVVLKANGAPVSDAPALVTVLEKVAKGKIVRLLVQRGRTRTFVAFTR